MTFYTPLAGIAASGVVGGGFPPPDANTLLLAYLNENSATSFKELVTGNDLVVEAGGTWVSETNAPTGLDRAIKVATGQGNLLPPSSGTFDMSAFTEWTSECFAMNGALDNGGQGGFFNTVAGNTGCWSATRNPNVAIESTNVITGNANMDAATWYHVCLMCRGGPNGTIKVYVDGVQAGGSASIDNAAVLGTAARPELGLRRRTAAIDNVNHRVSAWRVSNVARYAEGGFTPPTLPYS